MVQKAMGNAKASVKFQQSIVLVSIDCPRFVFDVRRDGKDVVDHLSMSSSEHHCSAKREVSPQLQSLNVWTLGTHPK
tara:strand:- start:932 stop:1162 length:231 start_codon:yes stop_codon:yes gene_type:complete